MPVVLLLCCTSLTKSNIVRAMFCSTPSCAILRMIIEAWPLLLYNIAYSLRVQKSSLVRNNWDWGLQLCYYPRIQASLTICSCTTPGNLVVLQCENRSEIRGCITFTTSKDLKTLSFVDLLGKTTLSFQERKSG